MSTPHKLNVTFWDMPEESNNGYDTKSESLKKAVLDPVCEFLRPLPIRFCFFAGLLLLAWASDVTGFVLPFVAVAAVHFWHAVFHRGKLSSELNHALFCASLFGEIAGAGFEFAGSFWIRTGIHSAVLALTSLLLGQEPTLMLYAGCRFFLWLCLPWLPGSARILLGYSSAVLGAMAAKYVEVFLMAQILPDVKLSTPRRRRTSNNAIFNVYKMRRTSLPALGGSNKSSHHPFGYQVSSIF